MNTLVVRMLVASIEMKDGNAIVIQVLTKKEMIALVSEQNNGWFTQHHNGRGLKNN